MSGNIIGVLGQRLVRKLCEKCKQAAPAEAIEKKLLGCGDDEEAVLYHAVGCSSCGGTGYRGRLAVIEVLRLDDEVDEMIAARATLISIKNTLMQKGFKTLADDAARRVLEGVTTLDEVSRVTDGSFINGQGIQIQGNRCAWQDAGGSTRGGKHSRP